MTDWQYAGLQQEEKSGMSGELPAQPARTTLTAFPSTTWKCLAAFLELAPDALIVADAAGTIVLVNAQMETLFGYRQDELVSQPLEIVLPEHLRAAHADQRTHYMHAARPRPMGIGLNLIGRRKDGSSFPVDISLRPILIEQTLHVMGAIRDMTTQRLAERERVHIAERLRQQDRLINIAHDAILVHDPTSHIISWNEGAEKLYGWTDQEVRGKITQVLLQTSFPASRGAVAQILEQQGQWEGELIHTCRDGKRVIVESRQVLMRDERGTPTAILEINRDVTERRRLEHVEQEARAEVDARLNVLQLILDRLPSGIFSAVRRAMASGEPILHHQLVIRQPAGARIPVLVDAIPLDALHRFHFPQCRGWMRQQMTLNERFPQCNGTDSLSTGPTSIQSTNSSAAHGATT